VYALAFGDSSVRAEARRALDAADADALFTAWARFYWSGSFFAQQSQAVSRAMLAPRHPAVARQFGWWGMVFTNAHLGKYQEAGQWLDSAAVFGEAGLFQTAPSLKVALHLTDGPDVSRAERGAAELSADPEPETRFWLGAFAASQGRWSDVDAHLRVLEAESESDAVVGSGVTTAEQGSLARALRGYAALRRGESQDARRDLEAALPGLSVDANGFVRYELGKLAVEKGDFQAAERYLESLEVYSQSRLVIASQVEYYLGETYEGLGDVDEARLHYARFVNWWDDADPELQPWVERGRQALERLTREAA